MHSFADFPQVLYPCSISSVPKEYLELQYSALSMLYPGFSRDFKSMYNGLKPWENPKYYVVTV